MSVLSTICLIGAGAWAAYAIWDYFFKANPGDGKGGFFDFVKNPGMFSGARETPPGNAFPLPTSDDPFEWDTAVRNAIEQQWDTFEYGRLSDRSPHLAPAAARVMRDRAFVGKAWPCEENALPHWNISALERLLGEVISIDVIPYVTPFLSHENEWCRNTAAEILGRIDFPESADAIRHCIRNGDDRTVSGLFLGMTRVVHERKGNDELILSIWDDVLQSIRSNKAGYGEIPTLIQRMAQADKEMAKKDLHSDDVVRFDHKNLDKILQGLRISGIQYSKTKTFELLKAWQREPVSEKWSAYHRGSVIGECLLCLLPEPPGDADDETKGLIQKLIEDSDGETRSRACPAYLAVHGITVDPAKICWEIIYERKGILSKEQRAYWEVNLLRNEVLNGGWHQYFVNSSGDGWKHCLDAVRSMGLETVERDLNAAIKLFSAQGPDVNRDKRWSQLSKFSKHKDNILEELGIDDHAVEVALAKFAVSHREDFLPLMPLK